ncbi:hypothetical protein M422DRAFT_269461 [Sphaerobolus stellatus SS14]|uniref:G domain-containing protein n=1 Tax=Sphaerobolus stellatus (strain SS14) TaxID=990650 RepID=A0A0C9U4J8_SPHS4|nr:hypothetical protein M422DRAFT_269461 [Sphaerobolus stellatus SS14]
MRRGIKRLKYPSEIDRDDIVIFLIGGVGTGKSSFKNILSRSGGAPVGHDLQSSTPKVEAIRLLGYPRHDSRLVILDTPGFQDPKMSDMHVLTTAATRFTILYFYRITDVRIDMKTLAMFKRLCGNEIFPQVVMVTTMWNNISNSDLDLSAKTREDQLRTQFWQPILYGGATYARFENTNASANQILDAALSKARHGQKMLIHKELADDDVELWETQAAQTLYDEIQVELAKEMGALKELIRMNRSSDPKWVADLEADYKETRGALKISASGPSRTPWSPFGQGKGWGRC